MSDVKLAEVLDDRTSFRRFGGFSATEGRPSALPSSDFAGCWLPTSLIGHCLKR
ncbi:hypothetical protein [Novosphingobium olei]|uniref:hypothetical protein n=1 Tax=Novosphingobium olei TaxID=2728851 RepID=UPI003B8A5A45